MTPSHLSNGALGNGALDSTKAPYWWQIRRVQELHLTRLADPQRARLSREQQYEEYRQVALLRQAMKDHDWYYCGNRQPFANARGIDGLTGDSVLVPDMTRTLQANLLYATNASVSSISASPPLPKRPAHSSPFLPDSERRLVNTTNCNDTQSLTNGLQPANNSMNCTGTAVPFPNAKSPLPFIRKRRWWELPRTDDDSQATRYRQPDEQHGERRPDSRFFWNEELLEPLIRRAHSTFSNVSIETTATSELCPYTFLLEHAIPVTSAFCGVQPNISLIDLEDDMVMPANDTLRYDQVMISRRSRFRAGTRFTRRGADATGAVANFAETEQIIVVWKDNKRGDGRGNSKAYSRNLHAVMSHVQTRGSIPLRWSSPTDIKTYRPRVMIGTDPMAQARSVREHLIDQASRYIIQPRQNYRHSITRKVEFSKPPSLLFVNLVDKKSDQGRLGRALDTVMKAVLDVYGNNNNTDTSLPWLNDSFIQLLWFDFHAEVKSGRWDKLMVLLKQVEPSLNSQGFFLADPITSVDGSFAGLQVKKVQTGVVRTNCMDCLDRTNVVQSIFGRYMLFHQLSTISDAPIHRSQKASFRQSPVALPWASGEVSHRLLWADNADLISRLYAGTVALKGDFTRTGKRTKKGALDDGMNSLQRYYFNNFLDADRQEGIDLLTRESSFTDLDEIDVSNNQQSDNQSSSSESQPMSIQQAARRLLLGNFDLQEKVKSDQNHVRIKVKSHAKAKEIDSPKETRVLEQRNLDLRWLTGDLQDQVRDLLSRYASKDDGAFESQECLQSMNLRAATDIPWWVTEDSSSDNDGPNDDGMQPQGNFEMYDRETAAATKLALLAGALVVGTQAPVAMATIVIGLVAASFSR